MTTQLSRSHNPRSAQEMMRDNLIVKHYAGSHAYGTATPTSDVDLRGIFCADPVNILTPFFPVRECVVLDEEDTKLYEVAHFMKLCLDCNPNIVETLWVDKQDIVQRSTAYTILRTNRRLFLSSKIAFTTSGYAIAQLKRIKGHNKWINNPQPVKPPQPVDFVSLVQAFMAGKIFPRDFDIRQWRKDHRLVPYGGNLFGLYWSNGSMLFDDSGQLNTRYDGDRHTLGLPVAIVQWNKEEYKLAKEKHEQYWTWKNNRNKTRSELEEKHAYDTKHAMHLVRLLRMGIEALRDGEIIVKRPDAEELLAIRNGKLTYEEILEYAEHMDHEIREVWYKKTELPKKPDVKIAAEVLMRVQEYIWDNQNNFRDQLPF